MIIIPAKDKVKNMSIIKSGKPLAFIKLEQQYDSVSLKDIGLERIKYLDIELLLNNATNKTSYLNLIINDDNDNSHYKSRIYTNLNNKPYIARFYKRQYTYAKINVQWIDGTVCAISYYGGISNTTKIVYYEYLLPVDAVYSISFNSKYKGVFGKGTRLIARGLYVEDINDN